MSNSPKKPDINIDNFTSYEDGDPIIPKIQLKLISSLVHNTNEKYTAQTISAQGKSTEEQLIKRLEQITSIRYELLTPFFFYSKDLPHILISKYEENDILIPKNSSKQVRDKNVYYLSQVFHETSKGNKLRWLDDTCKTRIALCIAKGMMYLHANGIVHQNLQPRTVKIVGDSYLPHIIDYGLNEFRGAPREVFPSRFLAPELNTIKDYSKETDVFAFGVLLCELLASKNFNISTKPPTNIKKAPPNLQKLIKKCLNENPNSRPTFSEIYELFKTHKVAYQETISDDVDEVVSILDEMDTRRNNTKFKSLIGLKPENVSELYKLVRMVDYENASSFFNIVGNNFGPKTDLKLFKAFLNVSLFLVQQKAFCHIFVQTETHLNLPFDKEQLYKQVLDIVYWILQYEPDAIQSISDGLIIIMKNPKYTKKILALCTSYLKQWDELSNPWALLDKVLSSLAQKNLKYQSNFISIFYTLCRNVRRYRKGRLRNCVDIISCLIDSPNHSTIRAVYAFLSEFKDEQIPRENLAVFYKHTAEHLLDPHTALSAVKFCLIKDKIEVSPEIVYAALRLATTSHLGNFLLCKIAEDPKGAAILMKQPNFIEVALPDLEGTLRVLLILLRKKQNKDEYRKSESLPYFLTQLCKNADLKMIKNIQNLLMLVKCDSKFIDELEENNFCEEFYTAVFDTREETTTKVFLIIFKNFALRNPTLKFFKKLIKQLRDNLSEMNNDTKASLDVIREILSLFSVLSAVIEYAPLFSDFKIDTEFKKLLYKNKDPDVKAWIKTFKDNMERYKHRMKKRAQSVS